MYSTDKNAIGEYTGAKPNEFVTLDKKAMETSGQIMYDTLNSSTLNVSRGNQCSTLDRRRSLLHVSQEVNYSGSVNYDTGKISKLLSGNVGIKINNNLTATDDLYTNMKQ